ncbi:MAG: MBL fold metallo-hydrolase [Lachnospiraceae bacterium]|nr:MBL fold metallo-hydrolase [Lachnospiraceae bacterium]
MRVMSIASGSSGNCIYVGSEQTHLLIDTGISCKKVNEGLKELGLTGADITAVLVTHEHADHIGGLGVFMRKYKTPVYSAEETIHQICSGKNIGKLPDGCFHPIAEGSRFSIGDIEVEPLAISHDAARPLAYRMDCEQSSAAVVTDLGYYDYHLADRLQGLDALVLEANHDLRMLEAGPYPYYLKRRIAGNHGHLSNEASGRFLNELLHENMKKILLGHISKENNMAALALETVKTEIELSASPWHAEEFSIEPAGRDCASEIIYI